MITVNEGVDGDVLEENLRALFIYVQRVRQEIAALNRSRDGEDKFATMGEQLDGIVEATMDATETIMGAVEENANIVHELRGLITEEKQKALLDKVLRNQNTVFEACAFQDLTGQRITKIIKSVSYVEDRVNALREVWGNKELETVEIEIQDDRTDDEKLLHGPQSKSKAISQDEIDKLFD